MNRNGYEYNNLEESSDDSSKQSPGRPVPESVGGSQTFWDRPERSLLRGVLHGGLVRQKGAFESSGLRRHGTIEDAQDDRRCHKKALSWCPDMRSQCTATANRTAASANACISKLPSQKQSDTQQSWRRECPASEMAWCFAHACHKLVAAQNG